MTGRRCVSVLGAGRGADNHYRSVLAGAFFAGTLQTSTTIPARMASNDSHSCRNTIAPTEISYHCNNWCSGGPSLSNPNVTSFEFLDEILMKVARKDVFPNLKGTSDEQLARRLAKQACERGVRNFGHGRGAPDDPGAPARGRPPT